MAVEMAVLRSARNAFLVLLLTLVGLAVYEFVSLGTVRPGTAIAWVAGAAVYFGSKWYYGRQDAGSAGDGPDTDPEN
jgi:hypothetical protein